MLRALNFSVTPHILEQVAVGGGFLRLVGDEGPGEDWVLGDIVVVPACDFVEPLEVLVVGDEFVDPQGWLGRSDVVREGVLLDLDVLLDDGQEGIHVPQVEVKQHLLPLLRLYVDRIAIRIEPLLIDLPDVTQGDIEVIKHLVLKGLYAHVVELRAPVGRAKDYKSFLAYPYLTFHHCEDVDEQALSLELFYVGFLLAVGRELVDT